MSRFTYVRIYCTYERFRILQYLFGSLDVVTATSFCWSLHAARHLLVLGAAEEEELLSPEAGASPGENTITSLNSPMRESTL